MAADNFFRHGTFHHHLAIRRELAGIFEPLQFLSFGNQRLHGWHVSDEGNLLGSRAFLHSRFTSDRITDYCGNESVEPALEWKYVARRQNRVSGTPDLRAWICLIRAIRVNLQFRPRLSAQKNSKKNLSDPRAFG